MSERATVDETDHEAGTSSVGAADVLPYLGIVVLYTATILGGLALADEIASMGLVMFEDPSDVGNVGVFAVLVLVMTGIMLLAFRYELGEELVRAFLLGSAGMLTAVAFVAVTGIGSVATESSLLLGLPTGPLTIGITVATAIGLWVYPEWYVNDIAAVVFGAAAIPMLGLGFGPLPIVVLLVAWAGYDAYSVYVSGHMQELAAGLGSLKAPIIFVVPHSLSYSMREDGFGLGGGDPDEDQGGEADTGNPEEDIEQPDVAILGLGDALIPGMLAVSAGQFLDAPMIVPALNANAPAVGAVLGGFVGMGGLLYLVHRVDGAHAGLPPLNAGVLGGYLIGAVVAGVPLTAALGL